MGRIVEFSDLPGRNHLSTGSYDIRPEAIQARSNDVTVKELRAALKGVLGDTPVAMVDEMSVVFAEMVDGVFIVSDMGPGYDEPMEYWREAEEGETTDQSIPTEAS